MAVIEDLAFLIENENESSCLDFKQEQYPLDRGHPKKPEFLKDISAFANYPSNDDKLIIVGVIEENGHAIAFNNIDSLHDQASYQIYLNEYIEPEINFEYRPFNYRGYRLAYFRIFGNIDRPYLFKKEVFKKGYNICQGTGFIRSQSSTTKLIRSDFNRIYELKKPDLSSGIIVNGRIDVCEDEEATDHGYFNLNIDIKNKLTKSVELSAEVKIPTSKDYLIDSAENLKLKWRDERFQRQQKEFFVHYVPEVWLPHSSVNHRYSGDSDYFHVNEITVLQAFVEKDIFDQQILIKFRKPCVVLVEVVIRCNDFSNGIIRYPIEIAWNQ